ncbi:EGF-like repeat and discoidin I-like domain-containing protein 3 [Actinia tenebrosa]|uniref:EGF-like repeat and discoidin I-like domain-containing protein 3 n=1 Tax=Actinia tenebrosa TaxID=6105 RepID=A0A6P8IGY5_ACTTE|nr:EGF-like repeat and discoidin I-like domain-containing protein 3 [Actinia tenebrosa]
MEKLKSQASGIQNMGVILFFIAGLIALSKGDGGCKVLDFLDCLKNKTFDGHVIKSFRILAPGLEDCQHKCYIEDNCVSYNLGPVEGMSRTCELNDADHVSDPGYVVSKEDFEYCPIKNPCSSNPCSPRQWCSPDFLWDTFNCSDGRWTQWSQWSHCNCSQTRNRVCISRMNANVPYSCEGSSLDVKKCKPAAKFACCSVPLGIQNGKIPDAQITASSVFEWDSKAMQPHYGRLHRQPTKAYDTAWCPSSKKIGEYLQIDLGSIKWITKVATQGQDYPHFQSRVTEYTLAFSNTSGTWEDYRINDNDITHFSGNFDKTTVVSHELSKPVKAQYVRFVVQSWNDFPCMRVELYGCTSV